MSFQGIILVLLSACCHASWNLLSKARAVDPLSFLIRALMYSAAFYLPLFLALQAVVHYDATVLLCVAGSGLCTGVYFFALAKAYHHGHVSIAYPIARTFPILVLAWAGLALGERPSALGVAGIVLVVAGCFLLPLKRFVIGPDGFAVGNYLNRSAVWAAVAALFTSAFSMVDRVAARSFPAAHVREGISGVLPPQWFDGAAGAWLLKMAPKVNYVYLQNLTAFVVMLALMKLGGLAAQRVSRRRAVSAGVIFLVSYALIMAALAVDRVAYVVTFRQVSIVMTAVLSMLAIERQFSWPRLAGVGVIFAGVVLVGIG